MHSLLSQRAGERKEEGGDLLLVINKAAGDIHLSRQPLPKKKHPSKGSFFEQSSEEKAFPYHKLPRWWYSRSPE